MKIPFSDLRTQYELIKEEISINMAEVIDGSSYILGEKVENFENKFANYCNSKYAVAVNSGTSALHLALVAKNIKYGDEVITSPNTFVATAEAISYTGAKPVFVDIDSKTYNIDIDKIERAITKKTKAIIPVHLYGHPVDMDPIMEIAEKYHLEIIEDCCQSHGSEYKEKRVPVSNIGCFSFYPSKNLGAYGEGGIIVTNDKEVAEKASILRDHGQKEKYVHEYIGYNYRMDGFQGAVLGVKLKYLDKWIELRRKNAKLYNELLEKTSIVIPSEAEYAKHVYYLYVIKVRDRDKLQSHLQKEGIATGLHYPIPIHLQNSYKYLNFLEGSYPVSESCVKEILSLPMYAELNEDQIKYIVSAIHDYYSK